ncbi:MAG TPA: coproporphyrinogen III oxidase family protein, partial [Candidatus Brocadiia bacterium]|nr:coproporphyrinogen III oxidase family protein [Candidatus Brocadiia bacterium]
EDLRYLGRPHAGADGPRAVSAARRAGFTNVSIDLIYGLPGSTRAGLELRLADALDACAPEHVSCYQLTYAEGTPLGREVAEGRVTPLSEDEELEQFVAVHETLERRGFFAYEVSNFALRKDLRSRHNLAYWRHVDYAGVGPGAHSFRWPDRWWNTRSVEDYCARVEAGKSAAEGREILTLRQLSAEALMLGLRTTDGIELAAHRERFGEDLAASKSEAFGRMVEEGLLVVDGLRARPTLKGLAVADSLARELM